MSREGFLLSIDVDHALKTVQKPGGTSRAARQSAAIKPAPAVAATVNEIGWRIGVDATCSL
jgi:hypothetical protein